MDRADGAGGHAADLAGVLLEEAVLAEVAHESEGHPPPEKATICADFRADGRTRTGDPFITSEVLYQLSYVGGAGRG
jgi:hypothetical protein